MKSNTQLLNVAKKQLGNTGGKYRNYVHASGSWCDMFVFWLYDANGCGSLLPWKGQQRTYCPSSIKWCDSNLAQIPPYLAMACDIIYYDWDKNRVPNHIGIVESKVSTSTIKAIEGNTSGGKVARKTREVKYVCGIYRPHFTHTFNDKRLAEDGDCQYQTIGGLQKTLKILGYYSGSIDCILGKGTVRGIQKLVGCKDDGAWGATTSGKFQQYLKNKGYYTGKVDKEFGKQSVLAMQKWINANAYQQKPASKPTAKPTTATSSNADKLVAKMKELAWAYGTAKSKYEYKTGAPTSACSTAMKTYGYSTKSKMSDCGNFVNTVVRSSGVDTSFTSLHAVKTPFSKSEAKFNIVHSGKAIPSGLLKAGDIIRYKKTSGGQHAMFYFGDGKVCDAGLHNRFGNIRKDEKRYAGSKVKKSTIQVLRVKG